MWWPVAGWVWGSGTACLDLCTACPRASIGGAVWPGVSGEMLQVAVVWGVQSHVFEPWGVAGVLVFCLRVCASIAVCVAV